MNNDLSEQSRNDLRRVLGEMESLAPVAPELETRPLDVRPYKRSRLNPLLVAFAAAVAVLALALPAVLHSPTPDSPGTDDSTPPASLAATPTTNPLTDTVITSDGWTITEVARLGTLLETTDAGFIAVSSHEVRTSNNGIEWQGSASLDGGVYVYDLEHRDSTFVAVGGFVDAGTGEAPTPAVWTSLDGGATWARVEVGMVADIAPTPDGFAAVGIERDDSDPDYNKTRGVLWTSPDGLSWTRVATSDDPEGVSSNFRNVVWDGQLVILGHRGADYVSEGSGLEDPSTHDNVTWFSDRTSLSDPSPSTLGGYLDESSTAATPHGIIALTHWSTPIVKTEAAAWISQDGINWTKLEIETGNYEYTDIGQTGDEVFLTGYEILDAEANGVDTAVWSSLDGTNWTRIELPELPDWTRLQQVVVSESAIVLAGDQSTTGIIASRLRR